MGGRGDEIRFGGVIVAAAVTHMGNGGLTLRARPAMPSAPRFLSDFLRVLSSLRVESGMSVPQPWWRRGAGGREVGGGYSGIGEGGGGAVARGIATRRDSSRSRGRRWRSTHHFLVLVDLLLLRVAEIVTHDLDSRGAEVRLLSSLGRHGE